MGRNITRREASAVNAWDSCNTTCSPTAATELRNHRWLLGAWYQFLTSSRAPSWKRSRGTGSLPGAQVGGGLEAAMTQLAPTSSDTTCAYMRVGDANHSDSCCLPRAAAFGSFTVATCASTTRAEPPHPPTLP